MNTESLKAALEKIPITALLLAYGVYLGWDYYDFMEGSSSPLVMKKSELQAAQTETEAQKKKAQAAQEFFKTLDQKRNELRALSIQLDELKGTLSSDVDVPAFMKMVITEAKKVGITVLGIRPQAPTKKDYYEEQPFEMGFRGVYVQLLVFLERLAQVQSIVRVENFDMKPISAPQAKYIELEGKVQIKAFKYLGTQADEIGKAMSQPKPGAPAAPPQGGAG